VNGLIDLRSGATPTAVVTGCAGFIGSHLSERLVADGIRVIGIDAFRPYYDRAAKVDNLAALTSEPNFELLELDLATADLAPLMASAGTVFHIAAQPGVRRSFGDGFTGYALDNMVATQRVFEAAGEAGCPRVVWASSSSVYGDAPAYPCVETTTPTEPRSPYGVTKRACEDLAAVYRMQGLSVVGLRYFTVYGPRQRPDMAIRRLCEALVGEGGAFPLFGDGNQTRDITYVGDVVEATVLAGRALDPNPIYNVGGGHEVTLNHVIATLEELAGRRVEIERFAPQTGDVRRTGADSTAARQSLGWHPNVPLAEGLANELEWVRTASAARVA
jgi:UDP-glucuronate 4-epimerase